jgi:plastocyanin
MATSIGKSGEVDVGRWTKRNSKMKKEAYSTDKVVKITNFEFSPTHLRISAGQKVTWTLAVDRDREEHLIKFLGEEKEEGGVAFNFNGKFSRTFTQPGTYDYYCERHVFMKGRITVQGSAQIPSVPEQKPSRLDESSVSSDVYADYLKKKEGSFSRQQLKKFRAKRDEKRDAANPAEVADDAPDVDAGHDDELVRFGSFDADEKDLLVESWCTTYVDSFDGETSPKFGSFSDVLDSNIDKTPPHLHFDSQSATNFLFERWESDVEDSEIKWI